MTARERWRSYLLEFWWFGLKEAWACAFAGGFFAVLALTSWLRFEHLPRYDAILLGALGLQALMLALRLETRVEVRAIAIFHVLGFALEAFKTHPAIGSWQYPEPGCSKLVGVPLYSGFMYAAVASYIVRAWRLFDLRLVGEPPTWLAALLAGAIYVNFFSHHFIGDYRWWLFAALAASYSRTWVYFTPRRYRLRMPLLLSFALIGFFVFVAENIATALHAWVYPYQASGWRAVHHGKIGSWTLLVVLSVVLVARLVPRESTAARDEA